MLRVQKLMLSLMLFVVLVLAAGPSRALTYDVAADFLPVNPNGVWSYGWTSQLGSNLNLYDQHNVLFGSLDYLSSSSLGLFPHVVHNPSASVVNTSTVDFQPGQLALHPGDARGDGIVRQSVVRWLAPEEGVYSLSTTFTAVDFYAAGTDVHVLLNGVSLFDGALGTYLTTQSYSAPNLNLHRGDTIDFVVGPGAGLNMNYDTTSIAANITRVNLTPCQAVSVLVEQVNATDISGGTKKSLIFKLNGACASFERGTMNAGVSQLNAFISEVQAQTGNGIDESTAAALIATAQWVISFIS